MSKKKFTGAVRRDRRKSIWKDTASWQMLLLAMPAIVGYTLFNYIPLVMSLVIPFKDYKFAKGIAGSDWVGFRNFGWMFTSSAMGRVIRNTFLYGLWFMMIGTVINIIIALLLFEVTNRRALKAYQTIITFPNFMSMVIVGYVVYAILSPRTGYLNQVIGLFGAEPVDAYMSPGAWPGILTIVSVWKGMGINSLFYFASLMAVDTQLYEAAQIDGANRFQRMWHISIPHLTSLACIFIILNAGKLINGNFDLFYIIPRDTPLLYSTTDILNTYVYRALATGKYSMGATVGLVQSVVGMILVVTANLIVRKISPDNSMF